MPLVVVAFFYGEAVYVCWWHSDPAISRYLSKLTAPATATPHDRWLDSPIGLALMAAASGREERAAGWALDAAHMHGRGARLDMVPAAQKQNGLCGVLLPSLSAAL